MASTNVPSNAPEFDIQAQSVFEARDNGLSRDLFLPRLLRLFGGPGGIEKGSQSGESSTGVTPDELSREQIFLGLEKVRGLEVWEASMSIRSHGSLTKVGTCEATFIHRSAYYNGVAEIARVLEQIPSRDQSHERSSSVFDRIGHLRLGFFNDAGLAEAFGRGDILIMDNIQVDNEHRRRDIGRKLLEGVIQTGRERSDYFHVLAESSSFHTGEVASSDAIAFLRSRGFRSTNGGTMFAFTPRPEHEVIGQGGYQPHGHAAHGYHQPLDDGRNEIRLVQIQPATPTSQLRCVMYHGTLEAATRYNALSYNWIGHDLAHHLAPVRLLVEDFTGTWATWITPNLASFLRCIAARPDAIRFRWWIDAICINQKNTPERSAQILRMRDIYRLAHRVVAWLGPEADESTAALAFIAKTREEAEQAGADATHPGIWSSRFLTTIADRIRSGETDHLWRAVLSLFERPWWSRTWIVQEALLAVDLRFNCSGVEIGWPELWQFLESLWAHSQWTAATIPDGAKLISASSPGRTILWLKSQAHNVDRDVLQLLYHLRHTKTTEPKDKLYGVLGLAWDAEELVRPDYDLPIKKIFVDLFTKMKTLKKNLDWLTLAWDTGANSATPTWYPDVNVPLRVVSINTSRSVNSEGFSAAGRSQPILAFSEDFSSCTVQGMILDKVDGFGTQQTTDKDEAVRDICQPRNHSTAYASDAELYAAIWISVVADQDFEGTEFAWRAPEYFQEIFARNALLATTRHELGIDLPPQSFIERWCSINQDLILGRRTLGEWTRHIQDHTDHPIPINEATDAAKNDYKFERRMRSSTGSRRLVVTECGYIGLGNEFVERGDLVCLFAGGRMPYVLRAVPGGYRFLGEAFIHGVMFGEEWNRRVFDAHDLEEFVMV